MNVKLDWLNIPEILSFEWLNNSQWVTNCSLKCWAKMSVLIKSSWASVRGKSSQTISLLINYRPKKWRIKPPVQLQNRFSSNMNMDIIHFQCFKRQIFNVTLNFHMSWFKWDEARDCVMKYKNNKVLQTASEKCVGNIGWTSVTLWLFSVFECQIPWK